jgi:selenocysteine lyase/cysteine desulfurase
MYLLNVKSSPEHIRAGQAVAVISCGSDGHDRAHPSRKAVQVLGPHLGLAFGRRELLESWRPYKVRPASNEPVGHRFETGTLPHELLAGFVAAVEYVESLGWDAIVAHERDLGARFLDGLPPRCRLHGLPTMDGRVPTFAFTLDALTAQEAATRLGERGFAVWLGDYYAVEVMRRLGLEDGGAVRVGIVHYNTAEEVDGLLEALTEI